MIQYAFFSVRSYHKNREFSFKRNCVMRRWESEILTKIINHEVGKAKLGSVSNLPYCSRS